jgi:predicted DCC family thiol-disulfide oxidoreductase YuxK
MVDGTAKPLLIYDGDCSFCRRWIGRWRDLTGNSVDYEPYQSAAPRFPQIAPERFGQAVHLVERDGAVSFGANAVFRTLALAGKKRYLLWLYREAPGFAAISEAVYGLIARHRNAADRLEWWLTGWQPAAPSYLLTRSIFLRLLGLIYLLAFLSLYRQMDGLVGSHGILPAADYLRAARQQLGRESYWILPTLAWLNSSDKALHLICLGGMGFSAVGMIGVLPALMLALAWICYLSLSVVGQDFLSFQWDALLLEAGFVAIFFAPILWMGSRRAPSPLILFLLRWILFRVMFLSAVVKLVSGDPTWRGLTALNFHYETQPLPTWIGWWAHQMPGWFQKFSVVLVFVIEGIVPFFYFAPRRPRIIAFWITLVFQVLIMLTGNYGFFNILTIALALVLLDDASWPARYRRKPIRAGVVWPWVRRAVLVPVSVAVLLVTTMQFIVKCGGQIEWPTAAAWVAGYLEPLRSFNSYGLFAVMTTQRPEIILEGSNDGNKWLAYSFRYKPDDPSKRPAFCQPHMPRLDWQLWFAAIPGYGVRPWFANLEYRLLTGEPAVLALLDYNPFPSRPPRYLRAVLYDYHFTDRATRARTGEWWSRRPLRLYTPVVSLPKDPWSDPFRF